MLNVTFIRTGEYETSVSQTGPRSQGASFVSLICGASKLEGTLFTKTNEAIVGVAVDTANMNQ
jgi:hypothetical protein